MRRMGWRMGEAWGSPGWNKLVGAGRGGEMRQSPRTGRALGEVARVPKAREGCLVARRRAKRIRVPGFFSKSPLLRKERPQAPGGLSLILWGLGEEGARRAPTPEYSAAWSLCLDHQRITLLHHRPAPLHRERPRAPPPPGLLRLFISPPLQRSRLSV